MITEIEKQNIIKSILNIRCREGSTIADIEGDYKELTGQTLLNAYIHLNAIDCVYCDVCSNGTTKWYVKSDNIKHITRLILEQRPAQQQQQQQQQPHQQKPKPQHVLNDTVNANDCFFKDNVIYKLRKMNSKYQQLIGFEDANNNNNSDSYHNLNSIASPPKKRLLPPSPPSIHLHAQLVGDDFFRTLVTRDTTNYMFNRNNGVQQIGFCVSGQTILGAAKHIEMAQYFKAPHLILNVGSVDILYGRSIVDMCMDFDTLIRACEQRGCKPIITTLAPLAQCKRSQEIHDKLNAFNFYLLNKYSVNYPLIDLWQQFAMRNGHICFDYYETEPMYVRDSNQSNVMWSNASRSMIRNHILKRLYTILEMSKPERVYFGA